MWEPSSRKQHCLLVGQVNAKTCACMLVFTPKRVSNKNLIEDPPAKLILFYIVGIPCFVEIPARGNTLDCFSMCFYTQSLKLSDTQ